ncbi:hypothetical protein M422DRAFT_252698, partial [Sphaerobolus stellatus SS14]
TEKVDPDVKDQNGLTPLYWAAKYGHGEVVELLLKTGVVDPNVKDEHGFTPLHWAASNSHREVSELLFRSGKLQF